MSDRRAFAAHELIKTLKCVPRLASRLEAEVDRGECEKSNERMYDAERNLARDQDRSLFDV
jgi:hypothetical protein